MPGFVLPRAISVSVAPVRATSVSDVSVRA
jgi:hypothetical protein